MTELKFYLLCFMIAAPQGALGSAAHSRSGAPTSRDYLSDYSISLPPDSEFVEKRVRTGDFYRNSINDYFVRTNTPEECLSKAISTGFPVFQLVRDGCLFFEIMNPVCNKWEGDTRIYIRKDMLSDGSPSDNASFDVESYQKYFPSIVLRFYRIESPTIFEFGNLVNSWEYPKAGAFKHFLTFDETKRVYSDSPVLADPSCYTTSTCSEIFLTSAPEIPASDLFILYDICGQTIQVDSGKSLHVLSHEGIGCKNFPNDYPVADCWVEFTGAGEITIDVAFVNFRESDQCDGFTMTAVTDDANGSSASTDLCDASAPTELTSAGGKVRIEFGSSASPTREKYGFNFHVTAA